MRELTIDELNAVVGGGPPSGYTEQRPGSGMSDIIIEDFFSFGYGEMSFGFWDDVKDTVKRIVDTLFPATGNAEERQAFMNHCASQGKTAVFTAGDGSIEVVADPITNKAGVRASQTGSTMRCQ